MLWFTNALALLAATLATTELRAHVKCFADSELHPSLGV
jgi:hypothetical protein